MSRRELFGIWHDTPVHRLVLEVLLSRPNGISDRELMGILKKDYGLSISRRELVQTLLKLEINGYVRVEHVGKLLIVRLNSSKFK